MTLIDELTGAGNQQFLMRNLKSHLQEASTRRGGVCLALVELRELDNVKATHKRIYYERSANQPAPAPTSLSKAHGPCGQNG